jgi:hypothetical protein
MMSLLDCLQSVTSQSSKYQPCYFITIIGSKQIRDTNIQLPVVLAGFLLFTPVRAAWRAVR